MLFRSRALRLGHCVHIALLTFVAKDNSAPELEILSRAMADLQNVILVSLRKGDVVSKYSGAQFVLMLPSANYENSVMVVERICNTFRNTYKRYTSLKLSYSIRDIDIAK